jgi:hypothetical protein
MDKSIKRRIKNQIIKFEANISINNEDSAFTLDYESGQYRQNDLIGLIRDTVPYFALTAKEISTLDLSEINRRSFTRISDAHKNSKGDYGELLLFLILDVFYKAPKFVTKARLRSNTGEQIKGFDCAHFSIEGDEVTLWLGEAKFHKNISSAISSALKSLQEHLNDQKRIKSELKILGGEIEVNSHLSETEHEKLLEYVSGDRSLDKVNIAVPVLITYNSNTIKSHNLKDTADLSCDAFREDLEKELHSHMTNIHSREWPARKSIRLIFIALPLESVEDLKTGIDLVEMAMKF